MHAEKLCHRWLLNVMPGMHRRRLLALVAVVGSVLRGGRLTITGLGRSLKGQAKIKHSIKRVDRLFSNRHLHSESEEIYRHLSQQVLGSIKQPIILVDWSDIDARRKFFLLRAAVAVKGRSLTLYEEVHTFTTKEKAKTHAQFLKNLKEILPKDCRPIIVSDAGYRTPWFRQVLALDWDYVGRVRNRDMVQLSQKAAWIGAKALYIRATNKAIFLSNVGLTRSNTLACSLILFKGKPKGRKRITKMGNNAQSRTSLVNSKRAREPWLLATSLSEKQATAKQIVKVYSSRMQIEETFRDLKCPRLGLSLYHNGTYKIERMKILILVGSIANTFAWLLGKAARMLNFHKQYQANTTTSVNVLSNVFIGNQIFRESQLKIPWHSFMKSIAHLKLFQLTNANRT
jgi:hypothetical protein